jgi:hypothetical protein
MEFHRTVRLHDVQRHGRQDREWQPHRRKVSREDQGEVRGKVVNLKAGIAGRAAAEKLQRTVVTKEGLAGFHPAHAAYVYSQTQASVMSEQFTALNGTAPFADIISKAEDLYTPSGPPMSPLTASYFHLPGLLRRVCRAGRRDYRHHRHGGGRCLRHARRAAARAGRIPRVSNRRFRR